MMMVNSGSLILDVLMSVVMYQPNSYLEF